MPVQEASQLKLHCGNEKADVIINIVGNNLTGKE